MLPHELLVYFSSLCRGSFARGVGVFGGLVLLQLRMHVFELRYVAVDLVDADLAGVVFVEHAEHALVLLLVNCELLAPRACAILELITEDHCWLQLHSVPPRHHCEGRVVFFGP